MDHVVPELQVRGLFRYEYEGRTLRENYGLARPESSFAQSESRLSQSASDGTVGGPREVAVTS